MTEQEEFEFRSRLEVEQAQPKAPTLPASSPSATLPANAGIANFMASVAGTPVDTAEHILNLGRAAYGTGARLLGAKLSAMPDLRFGSVGGSEWLKNLLRSTGEPGLSPDNPEPKSALGTAQYNFTSRGGFIPGGAIPAATSMAAESLGGPEWGQVGAMAGLPLGQAASHLIKPMTPSPAAQRLLGKDIVPTIGQAADQGSLLGRFLKASEEKLASVPLLGDIIKNARMRPFEETNLAALKTVNPDAKTIGHTGIAQAEEHVSSLYDSALGKFTAGVSADRPFAVAALGAAENPALLLRPAQKRQYEQFVNGVVNKAFAENEGTIDAQLAKKIDSEIGARARSLRSSSVTSERDLGQAFQSLQSSWRELITRNAPSEEVLAELTDANRKWANFVRIRDAASSPGAKEGVFSPAQLQAAVRRGDRTVGHGGFARGEALMQDLSGPAKAVLQDSMPNSTTADRLLFAHMLSHPIGTAVGAGLSIPAAALYSRLGQRYMLGDLPAQGLLADMARRNAPYGALGTGILAQGQP